MGNSIFAACQWGMVILIAKLGNAAMVGQFTLGLAITAPIMLLADLKLRDVQATDARHEYQFGHYLGLRLLTITSALFIITLIVWCMGYRAEKAWIILTIALAKAFDSLSDILYGFLQQQERMNRIAISRIIQGIIQVCALGLVLILSHSLLWGTVALAIGSGIVTIAYDIRSVRLIYAMAAAQKTGFTEVVGPLRPRINLALLAQLFVLTLPLGLAVMLGSLWINIPRYLIEHFLGEYNLGIFAAMAALLTVGGTIIGALGQTVSPRLAKYYAAGNIEAFDHVMLRLIASGLLIGLSGFLAAKYGGGYLLSLIYRPEYGMYQSVLVWLMAASIIQFTYVFVGTGLQAMRNFQVHLPIQIGTCIVVFLLSESLVGSYRLMGAAWAMFGANLFAFVCFLYVFFHVRQKHNRVIRSRL